ncbi:MAG: conjugal transfer protein TraB [Flavobacterium psychrophilum]|nr:MAG: conjugal transfer protein TraB [Flavobacterium psychrophilum]
MATGKKNNEFEKPNVDEDYLMNIISGEQTDRSKAPEVSGESKKRNTTRQQPAKKTGYEDIFLVNRFPSGRNGKVVYIRPEFHERLLRIVQLTREDKTTLYSYIDNILEHHFSEFGDDITNYFNEHFKPIL